MHPSWVEILKEEFQKDYFKHLVNFVKEEYKTKVVYPPAKQIFNAFDSCTFDNLKVVIIGQDPYHGYKQANGLCFSVNNGVSFPPSLQNIFKELENDIGIEYPKNGDLQNWAKQGVLLLNTILTVKNASPGSHKNRGWEIFTDSVIRYISEEKKNIVFLLWGGYAKEKIRLIDTSKHTILTSGHPSPLSANRGYWFGNKHFSKTNELLNKNKLIEINWKL